MKTIGKRVLRWRNGIARRERDELAVEEPLEIRVDATPVSVTMRTPGHDEELAAGFLFTEALVTSREQIVRIQSNARNTLGNSVDVFLERDVSMSLERLRRNIFVSSSCGLCGKASIATVHQQFAPLRAGGIKIAASELLAMPGKMRVAQEAFARTGGLHAAALFTARGELLVLREDIGRHNAVDKVVGFGLLNGLLPCDKHVLVVSGRASFEILQKGLAARVPIVCAVSAPSSLAVQFARKSRMTLVGFMRDEQMNVYAGELRINATPAKR